MLRSGWGRLVLMGLVLAGGAEAADLPPLPPLVETPGSAWNWTGSYVGAHTGMALGLNTIADPLGPSIFGDTVRSPGFLGGLQVGWNWQPVGSRWVLGTEVATSLAGLDGTNTCYAASGAFTSFNCRARTDVLGTATGRAGLTFGEFGRSLAYVKGGLAWSHTEFETLLNENLFGLGATARTSAFGLGWTVGAGAEYALSAHWTAKAEYDYRDLGSVAMAAPRSSPVTIPDIGPPSGVLIAVPGTDVAQRIHAVTLGVNYRFGPDTAPFQDGMTMPFASLLSRATRRVPKPAFAADWSFEGGGRVWVSSGRFQKDIAGGNLGYQNPTVNVSRLTWDNLAATTGEAFGRLDTPWNVFVKGFVGGGTLSGGKINDEDWGIDSSFAGVNTAYSNTEGDASGRLSYATIDAGYDVFRGASYKVGGFVGYNVYRDDKSSYTCTQIALPASGICSPPFAGFVLGENDRWRALRLGTAAEVMLTPSLKLTADVAYLPWVKFDGQDFHPQRPFVADEWGQGIGAQAELFVTWYVTPQISVGAGGRYWAMWTTSGSACRQPPNGDCPVPLQDMQFKTERFGALFQAAYRWDAPAAVVARD